MVPFTTGRAGYRPLTVYRGVSSGPGELGDRVEFIVPHCDPMVNLYDSIFVMKGDTVEAVWPITARGKSQ